MGNNLSIMGEALQGTIEYHGTWFRLYEALAKYREDRKKRGYYDNCILITGRAGARQVHKALVEEAKKYTQDV